MSVGVNVAVIVDEPAPATVAVAPLSEITDGSDDAYVNVPTGEDVGVPMAKSASPKVFDNADHDKDGVALPIDTDDDDAEP